MTKEKTAKLIRIITIPPVMVTALLLILYCNKRALFHDGSDLVVMIVLLGLFPVLAYPLQMIIPGLSATGRAGQRKLAFIMNAIGYTAAFAWAFVSRLDKGLILICSTYFFRF